MADPNYTLIFPHIPKTGGTTLLYHFSQSLGQDHIFVLGRHNRVRRFFDDQPQFEWAPPADIAKVKVFQGHGVDQGLLPHVDPDRAKLIVVLRDPVGRTKSAFRQQEGRHKRSGDKLSVDAFMGKDWDNTICNVLVRWFPDFIQDSSGTLFDKACDVLRCFDYVLTTEGMDQQLPPLLEHLKIPANIERRRVSTQRQDITFDDDAIRARNQADTALFNACSTPTEFRDGRFNALGFDADARAAAMARVRQVTADAQSPEDRAHYAYSELARGLCIELVAEKALAKLDEDGDRVAVPDPQAFRAILENVWAERQGRLSASKRENSRQKLEKYVKRRALRARRRARSA